MRRIVLVTALVASSCALLLAVSSAASAETTPEWAECVKVKGGPYEKGCGKEGGKGGYVLKSGIGAGGHFEAKDKNGLSFEVSEPGKGTGTITCKSAKEDGERVMPNLLENVSITLVECSSAKGGSCYHAEEAGFNPKYIELEPLDGELGYISRSPLKVGVELYNRGERGGAIVPHVSCHTTYSQRWDGVLDGEVDVSGKKPAFSYALGSYMGEVEPGYTPLTNQPFEDGEAGSFRAEVKHGTCCESWGPTGGMPGGLQGSFEVKGAFTVAG